MHHPKQQHTVQNNQSRGTRAQVFLRSLFFVGLLSIAGNAAAALDVTLTIKNEADELGNYPLLEGTTLKVKWEINADDGDELHHKDKIQLVRASDDEIIVDAVKREGDGKTSGTIKLTIPNAGSEDGDELFVRYFTRGDAGFEVVRLGLPADGGPTLTAVDKLGGGDLSAAVYQLQTGAVSVQARALQSEGQNSSQPTLCVWNTSGDNRGYFLTVAGSESASCDLTGALSLPHGRTLTEFHCTVLDDDAGNDLDPRVNRVDLETGTDVDIFNAANSVDSASVQVVSDTSISAANALVDNTRYAYSIEINYSTSDFTTLGTAGAVYGCSVHYK
jgi:hypothetical protein